MVGSILVQMKMMSFYKGIMVFMMTGLKKKKKKKKNTVSC